eukprot:gene6997-1645_t
MTKPRKWRTMHKWHRHSIHHLSFSDLNPAYAYVSGMDNECVLGLWSSCSARVSTNPGTTQGHSTQSHSRAMGPVAELAALQEAGKNSDKEGLEQPVPKEDAPSKPGECAEGRRTQSHSRAMGPVAELAALQEAGKNSDKEGLEQPVPEEDAPSKPGDTNADATQGHSTQSHSRAMGPVAELAALQEAGKYSDKEGLEQPVPTEYAPSKPGFSFRGDSRWLGMAHAVDTAGKDATTETIVAYAQTGSLFVARCSVTDQ